MDINKHEFRKRRPRSFTVILYTFDNVPVFFRGKKVDLETLRPDYSRYPMNQLVADVDWGKLNLNVDQQEVQKTEHIEVLKERDESHSVWDKMMVSVSVFVFSFGLGWFAAGGVKTKKKHA